MEIVNESNVATTWYCYNSYDTIKTTELSKGDLAANGARVSYNPPKNDTGYYWVKFHPKGGGGIAVPPSLRGTFGEGQVAASGTIRLKGSGKPYQVDNSAEGYQVG